MPSATPFLWLQHSVDEAARFYADTFGATVLALDSGPAMQSATVEILGQTVHLFHAGQFRPLTEAFSLMVTCSTQAEIDAYWGALCEGGTPSACGWVTDRFGVTWQVIPDRLQEWLGDPARGAAVQQCMLQMVKIEIAPLRAALDGD